VEAPYSWEITALLLLGTLFGRHLRRLGLLRAGRLGAGRGLVRESGGETAVGTGGSNAGASRGTSLSWRARNVLTRGLQRWLVGGGEQSSTVGSGIVDELPLVVVFLLIEDANCLFLADAGNSHNWPAAESLGSSAEGRASRLTSRSKAGLPHTGLTGLSEALLAEAGLSESRLTES
jgi:hypothetical protein